MTHHNPIQDNEIGLAIELRQEGVSWKLIAYGLNRSESGIRHAVESRTKPSYASPGIVETLAKYAKAGHSQMHAHRELGISRRTIRDYTSEYAIQWRPTTQTLEFLLRRKTQGPGPRKLTDDQVRTIRATPNAHGMAGKLARRYKVTKCCIRRVWAGTTWQHVK